MPLTAWKGFPGSRIEVLSDHPHQEDRDDVGEDDGDDATGGVVALASGLLLTVCAMVVVLRRTPALAPPGG